MIRKILFTYLLAFVLNSIILPLKVMAQQLTEQLGYDPAVTMGTLPNGLKYYIRPNQKPAQKVELRLVIHAGSVLEDEDQQGLAHFTEHMLFNGTRHFPKNKLVDYLQSIGVSFGADLNAYTSFDETVYILPVPTDKPDNLEHGFQILQDWAQGALLTEKDINEERGVVLEELRLDKTGARGRLQDLFFPKLRAGRYGIRLPIGKEQLLKTFKPEAVRRFYKDWYRPDLMAVIVVGDITKEKAETMIKQYFGSLTNPVPSRPRTVYAAKPYTGTEALFLTDPEQERTVFQVVFSPRKAVHNITVGDYRNMLIKNLALSVLNQRLSDLSQGASPSFSVAGIYNTRWAMKDNALNIMVFEEKNLDMAIHTAIGELLIMQQYGCTEAELSMVKKSMLGSMEQIHNERYTCKSSDYADEYIRNFLVQESIPGIDKELSLYKHLLPGITPEDIRAVLNKMCTPADHQRFFTFVRSAPAKDKKINSESSLLAAVKAAFAQKVKAKTVEIIPDRLLDTIPAKGSIVSTSHNEQLATTTYTLSNGIKVTVKRTDFSTDEILLKGIKQGGRSIYEPADLTNARYIPSIIEAMGYGQFNPSVLSKVLAGTNTGLLPDMGIINHGVSGQSDVKHLETLLQLVYLQLSKPRTDAGLFNAFKDRLKEDIQSLKIIPQNSFYDTLIKTQYNNDPRVLSFFPTDEQFNNLDAVHTVELYRQAYSTADGYHFFIVGNVDETTLKPMLETYLASLPNKGTIPAFKDNGARPKPGNNRLVYQKGKDSLSVFSGEYFGELPYSEDMDLKAALIADILTIRIIEKLREEMGVIYSGGVYAHFLRDPYPRYSLSSDLSMGPQNVAAVQLALEKEITQLKTKGPEQKDLEKVKITTLEQRKENLKNNKYWLNKIQYLEFEHYSTENFLNFDQRLNSITVEDIRAAAAQFFDGKNSFIGILQPETAKK